MMQIPDWNEEPDIETEWIPNRIEVLTALLEGFKDGASDPNVGVGQVVQVATSIATFCQMLNQDLVAVLDHYQEAQEVRE